MQSFNHWINSLKLPSSNSQSVSIMAVLPGFSLVDGFALEQNRNLVRRSPTSEAKNSGVHCKHVHCFAAPLKTAGSVRFKIWILSFSGLEISEILSTSRWRLLFTFASAILELRHVTVVPLYKIVYIPEVMTQEAGHLDPWGHPVTYRHARTVISYYRHDESSLLFFCQKTIPLLDLALSFCLCRSFSI